MSYDIYLLKLEQGEPIDKAIERIFSEESEEINHGLPNPEKERQKQRLAAELIKKNADLEIFRFGYKEIAATYGISEEEARIKYRHIELNGPEDGSGIQITLYDDSATVTVPYWYKGEKARATLEEVWEYLKIIQREAGYFVYDPQLEVVLDLSSDFSKVMSPYIDTVKWAEETIISPKEEEKKPWWRFW